MRNISEAALKEVNFESSVQNPVLKRGAGILLSVASLPSSFGIGDFGPSALDFANFLARSKQKYWQLLPLTPVEKKMGYSPYSPVSSIAGNVLFISPELLLEDKLLDPSELTAHRLNNSSAINYEEVIQIKTNLFEKAYQNFCENTIPGLLQPFEQFCRQESSWLDDFALYQVLKKHHSYDPWYSWPQPLRLREEGALKQFSQKKSRELRQAKWLQFIFFRQWLKLKHYCNGLNISLIGDLSFYVGYDSADVWAYSKIFSLDTYGNLTQIAGVPPDYFNAEGQVWNTPVFRWDILKKQKYEWWIERLRKNLELFDVLRLDHFRGFSAYWEIPANETTARNGQWKPGPGASLFTLAEEELGELPFIAEDLGDIDLPVYRLRDQFRFPGMKVLQFAFGKDMPQSANIPHNFTRNCAVYTGTHDNNTTKGWFRKDLKKKEKKRIKKYLGEESVNSKNIHKLLSRLAYASVSHLVLLPMQDLLGLGQSARMNTPATNANNWIWRLKPRQAGRKIEKRLRRWVRIYNR